MSNQITETPKDEPLRGSVHRLGRMPRKYWLVTGDGIPMWQVRVYPHRASELAARFRNKFGLTLMRHCKHLTAPTHPPDGRK